MLQNAKHSNGNSSSDSSNICSYNTNSNNNNHEINDDENNDNDTNKHCIPSNNDSQKIGFVGAFQPVKPRGNVSLSPVVSCMESSATKPEEKLLSRQMDEMAVDSSTPTTTTTERRKKKPYKELTLEEKVQLIRLAEENAGMSQASIAERYSIAKSNVCRILQRKHEYLRAYECAGFAGSRKRKLRGDPQQQQNQHQQQSRVNSCRELNNSLMTAETARKHGITGSQANYPEISGTTEQATTDNHCVIPQRPTAIIRRGNETLRAHMYKQHQISRMFMCRCCNWAFPDKTSLHMHIQAKEEGKTISVPVIGKGNPPTSHQNPHQQQQQHTQQQNENLTVSNVLVEDGRHSPQASTLHMPQPRVPTTNPFAPLQLHSLMTLTPQQAVNLNDQTSLQAAAATLFPQMALLRGASGSGTHVDDLMSKLRERLMLNNLVAQSSFNLAAWLATYPKIDHANKNGTDGNPLDLCSLKESRVNLIPEDDEINVDKEYDDEILTHEQNTTNDQQSSNIVEFSAKDSSAVTRTSREVVSSTNADYKERPKSAQETNKALHESLLRPASDTAVIRTTSLSTMPNLRSAISNSLKNDMNSALKNETCKSLLLTDTPNKSLDSIIISNRSNTNSSNNVIEEHVLSEASDTIENHISPSETHSSTSNGTSPPDSRECFECAVYRGKLAVAESRCQYLEERTATLQSDAIRFSTRVTVSETSSRQFEQESRFLRDQNEVLQRKLLECQEKTLAFMQGDQASNAQAVALYLNDILKTTFLR